MIDSVENNDSDRIRDAMIRAGIDDSKTREGLINFAKMTSGDIVLVLPIPEHEDRVFTVKIKSQNARGILNLQKNLQASYATKILDPIWKKDRF